MLLRQKRRSSIYILGCTGVVPRAGILTLDIPAHPLQSGRAFQATQTLVLKKCESRRYVTLGTYTVVGHGAGLFHIGRVAARDRLADLGSRSTWA